ncbi:hypothetical protein [Saccharomonospora halophila]|uniref:hypothetical protein n=1 Tax=Saccharomonospora halophila TaxID=129922 RepID=UPI00036D2EDC|nr:hypothetical protein [Saccharomonospora halophila]
MAALSLTITVDTAVVDAEEHEAHTADLGRRLRESAGSLRASPAPVAEAPPGAKGLGSALVAGFEVTVTASRRTLAAVIETLRAWTTAVTSRSVVVELDGDRLEITGATTEQIDHVLEAFLDRHTPGS